MRYRRVEMSYCKGIETYCKGYGYLNAPLCEPSYSLTNWVMASLLFVFFMAGFITLRAVVA